MDRQKQNFLNILNAYVNDTPINVEEPDYDEILRLAGINSLDAVVYSALKQREITPNGFDMQSLEDEMGVTVIYTVKQEYMAKEVLRLLNDNNIRHIVFKGYVIKDVYPSPELRTMGDIDIIIDSEDRKKVFDILAANKFEFDDYTSHSEVLNYFKNGVMFEVHTKIFEDEKLAEYYKDCFKFAKCVEGCTYNFKTDDHFVYVLLHMAKHFAEGGCGIRMLMDVVFYVKKYFAEMDWAYISAQLKQLDIYGFAKHTLAMANQYFGVEYPFEEKVDADISVLEYMINGGVFGYEDRNVDSIRVVEKNEGKFNPLSLVFPPYEELTRRYLWAKKIPKFLLPVGWIAMWFYRLFIVKENSFKRFFTLLQSKKDAVKHKEMMKKAGL